jgi:hypothetical protein
MKKNYENSRARVTEFIQQNSYQWFFRAWLHFINVTFIQNTQKQQSSHQGCFVITYYSYLRLFFGLFTLVGDFPFAVNVKTGPA